MPLVREGWISLFGFAIGASILLFQSFSKFQSLLSLILIHAAHLMGSVLLIPKLLSLSTFQGEVFGIGTFLGMGCSIGLFIAYSSDTFSNFGVYLMFLTLFHYLEFLITAISNPKNLTKDSYLINHGKEYGAALLSSWIEYFLEVYFFGKSFGGMLSLTGVCLCLFGDVVRKTAMVQAGASFNHIVQSDRKGDHVLIREGLYAYSRHPSYVGWFLWSAGTQLILLNPICFLAYVLVTWQFFNQRIYYEEYTLLNFFGDSYKDYMDSVPVGIPFIKGFSLKDA